MERFPIFPDHARLLLAYHGLAALPKHETKRKTDGAKAKLGVQNQADESG
ncbi:MAG TPA: hypothetical protein VF583_30185 [Bradyrhizobium sp.]